MKLEEKIEYYNENIDNPLIYNEGLKFKKDLLIKGNIFFISGIILTCLSFIAFVTLTIIFLVKKELSLFQLIPFTTMILFSILIFIGILFKKLSQTIIVKE